MNQNEQHGTGRRMAPAAHPALAAGIATASASAIGLLAWSLVPEGEARAVLVVAPFLLAPFAVAAATWVASRRALHELLDPMTRNVERLFATETAVPVLPNALETAPLAAALERSRLAVADRSRTGKIHAAVARLLGAGISRLAEGDYKVRITVDLPELYRPYQDDFNRAMENLEAMLAASTSPDARLAAQAGDIAAAAEQLAKRAEKLAQRIEDDLATIEQTAPADPQEALKVACHTLNGARVAAQRNIDAAHSFAAMANHLSALAEGNEPPQAIEDEDVPAHEAPPVFPAPAAAAASIGNAALKMDV